MKEKTFTRWIARDKDNSLWMHAAKPTDDDGYYMSDRRSIEIFSRDYPEFAHIKYEDGPIEIEISIKD